MNYSPYPESNYDAAIRENARQQLKKPNKAICIYCREQAITEMVITHKPDCPTKSK